MTIPIGIPIAVGSKVRLNIETFKSHKWYGIDEIEISFIMENQDRVYEVKKDWFEPFLNHSTNTYRYELNAEEFTEKSFRGDELMLVEENEE